jgi:hypothetical protein
MLSFEGAIFYSDDAGEAETGNAGEQPVEE